MSFQFCSPGIINDFDYFKNIFQSPTGNRNGGPSICSTSSTANGYVKKYVEAGNEYWIRMYYLLSATFPSSSKLFSIYSDDATVLAHIGVSSNNKFSIYRDSTTLLATGNFSNSPNIGFSIEFHLKEIQLMG